MAATPAHAPAARRWRRLGALLALVLLGSLGPALPASAHAALASSDPGVGTVLRAAPHSARLSFNEPVSPVPGGFALYDSDGRYPSDEAPATLGASSLDTVVTVELPADLAQGSYLLGWRVVSADSHPISGVVSFAVGEPSVTAPQVPAGDPDSLATPVNAAVLVVQVLGYLGLLGAVGLSVFGLLVTDGRPGRTGARLAAAGLALAIVSFGLLAGLSAVREQSGPLRDLLAVPTWRTGASSPAAAAFALVLAGSLLLMAAGRAPHRAARGLTLLGALVATAAVLPSGHTRTVEPTWLMAGLDLVHAAAGAVWFGGVLGLGLHLRRQHREHRDPVPVAAVVARFSALAGVLVALLGLSGVAMAALVLGSPGAVLRTDYGRTLLTKLGLVGVIALLAGWNKFHLVRVVARQPGPGPQWRRLRAAVLDEALLVVAVIAVTGLLTLQNPGAGAPAPDGSTTAGTGVARVPANDLGSTGGLQRSGLGSGSVAGRLNPAVVGPNTFDFTLRDGDGQPLAPDQAPVVTAGLPDGQLGPLAATVTRLPGTGHYRADMVLPAAGAWRVQVAVRTDRFSEPTAVLTFTVRR